jgi:hypothetical protein
VLAIRDSWPILHCPSNKCFLACRMWLLSSGMAFSKQVKKPLLHRWKQKNSTNSK